MVVQKTYTVTTKRISRDDNKVRADKQRRQFFTSIKAQLKILKQVKKLTYDKSEMAFLILRANFQLKSEATADLRLFIVFFFLPRKTFGRTLTLGKTGNLLVRPRTLSHTHTLTHTPTYAALTYWHIRSNPQILPSVRHTSQLAGISSQNRKPLTRSFPRLYQQVLAARTSTSELKPKPIPMRKTERGAQPAKRTCCSTTIRSETSWPRLTWVRGAFARTIDRMLPDEVAERRRAELLPLNLFRQVWWVKLASALRRICQLILIKKVKSACNWLL